VAIGDASEWKSIQAEKNSCPPVPVKWQRQVVKVFKGKRYPKLFKSTNKRVTKALTYQTLIDIYLMRSNPYPQKMIPATIAAIEVKTIMKDWLRVEVIVATPARPLKVAQAMKHGTRTTFL